ncbi:MAG TPA: hypothetical protein VEB86_19450, partial [Chryseosolibacter sp.]|nr:hypothetical protein [Chryseosolibacter sp.]
HIIQARVMDQTGQPASGVMTYMASPDKVINLYTSVSNKKGYVKFEVPKLVGSRQIILQTAHDSTYQILVEEPFSQEPSERPAALVLDRKAERRLIERTIAMQVQDIFHEHNREGVQAVNSDSTAFYGRADEIYYLDDYTRFPVMEEVMREYVPGVLVRKRRDGFHFLVVDAVNKSVMQGDPLILLDGMPVKDADDIMRVDPRKIRKLEVITRPYFLGPATFKGIVSYTTYDGDLAGFEMSPGVVTVDYEGLQARREFYAPRYETEATRNERTPDQRSLLYWNPSVSITADGKAVFDFFTSDQEGQFLIHVEGMTRGGNAGSATAVFTVKRFDN